MNNRKSYGLAKRALCFICFFVLLSTLLGKLYAVQAEESDFTLKCYSDSRVYVGGMPFGVRFNSDEVTVIKLNEFVCGGKNVCPAFEAGLMPRDVIISINGNEVHSVAEVMSSLGKVNGSSVNLKIRRNSSEVDLNLFPKQCDETGSYKLGVLLRDSTAGIGTVTFIAKDGVSFAGLGHGICSSETGKVLKLDGGYISNVKIHDIHAGKCGTPGELCGSFEGKKCGKLIANTEVGVFAIYTERQNKIETPIEIAEKAEVKTGAATIICTLDDNQRNKYDIEIISIDNSNETKNYIIRVTDKDLIKKTGGIVQGMSGSPIIQNGKLVGAITHVMINDPATGYGIYIGNMLDEMRNCI